MQPHSHISFIEQGDLDGLQACDPQVLCLWRSHQHGNTLMHHAARHGHDPKRLLPFLVEIGLDVHARNLRGQTPIMGIFERPADQVMDWMEALVEHGARVDVHDILGGSFVAQCTRHQHWGALRRALELGAGRHVPGSSWKGSAEYPIYQQQRARRVKESHLMQRLDQLDVLCPPTQEDLDRSFLLAIRHNAMDIAQRLHARGARCTGVDDKGNTLVHLIAQHLLYNNPLPNACWPWVRQAVAEGAPWRQSNGKDQAVGALLAQAALPGQAMAMRMAMAEGEAQALDAQVATIAHRSAQRQRF